MQGVLNTHNMDQAVDCLHLSLKPLTLDRLFLIEFGDHRLKIELAHYRSVPELGPPVPLGRH